MPEDKKKYDKPTLEKREELVEVTEGGVQEVT